VTVKAGLKASAALLALMFLVVCAFQSPTYSYRYRLMLEVEMPDGTLRSGSSVVWVEQGCQFSPAPPGRTFQRVTGEATALDLGGGRLLVALLSGQFPYAPGWGRTEPTEVLARVYGLDVRWPAGRCRNPGLGRLEEQRGPREIGPDDLPRLVTFADAAKPWTVKQVDPRDLAASFGPGVRLRRVTIEVTGDWPAEGAIERALPWLPGVAKHGGALDGARFSSSNALPNSLGALAFKQRRRL
jgi:hypothetical protein